jgi:prepilin-type N-terminal cleavage/methylation domain-containing protein
MIAVTRTLRGRPVRRAPRRLRNRSGFTVVELVVAMLVLAIGMLGMASTSVMLTRQISSNRQQTIAATLAQSRFEQLRSVQCTSIAPGSASARGVTEVWFKRDTTRAVVVTDTVKWTIRGSEKRHVYRSVIPCPANP